MARFVTLEEFKQHTRTNDFMEDDLKLQRSLDAAETYVIGLIGYTEEELSVIPADKFPSDLVSAICMRGASMYEHSTDIDSSSLSYLPGSTIDIVKPYQKLYGGGRMEKILAKYANVEGNE